MIMNLFIIFLFTGLLKLQGSKSLISCILSLEMISGSCILLSCYSLIEVEVIILLILSIILLILFIVLESVLGLSIFVYSSRKSGNDFLKSINLLKF